MEEKSYVAKLNIIGEKVSHYFYGKFFPVQIALLVTLCYIADVAIVGLFIVSILASFIFIFYKDVSPIIPLLLMVVMLCRDYSIFNDVKPYVTLIPAGAAFIARLFLYPIKWRKPNAFVLSLVFVSLAFAFAGITRADYDFMFGIAYFISLGPTMIVIYLFFSYNFYPRKDFCLKKYLCYSLMAAGLAMAVEIIYVRYVIQPEEWTELGWINVNGCAAFLLLSIPACYYLIVKSRKISALLVCLLSLYAGLLVSGSDAALGIALVFSPFLILFTYRNLYRTKRKVFAYSVALILITIGSAIIVLVSIYGYDGMLELLQIDPSASGRNDIYLKAIELFRESPIFGYGFQYNPEGRENSAIGLYNFHSTLFHVMATMGIFGLVAYAFYFVVRFIILMRSYSPFTMTMLTAFIMYECYAMVDTGEFNAIPLMSAITVMIAVVEWATKKDNATSALPLTTNKRNGYYF